MSDKPPLGVVLDHYDIAYRPGRVRQKICCPVHDEKEPSCSIDLEDDWFNCHACHAGGDAFSLIMLKEGVDFATARTRAEEITGRGGYGLSQPDEPGRAGIFGPSRSGRGGGGRLPFRPRIFSS